ncbi:hypothetical protein P171DRAFT_428965 [Karstenula rhodostoma CBS 690.94]|uniref:RNase III domain-containing protein n=1 Tax=Karstenula rhodostoma CBS 690.94 TaxID=1392251 RepID=A0A9P4UEK5_9PLEO|nr:hypothetical protein P171DRAFT_428965 [Karstenula rhodostoma CBS 690.94]
MEIEQVQAQIGYQFAGPDRLRLALTAAHRSGIDGTSDDGNRGLAKLGMCAVEMTETYWTIIVEKGTSKDANVQDHWFKNKRKRASVCRILGIDHCLTQSVRQQDRAPSTDVLATALSAILGAIWLDLQTQNRDFPIIVEQTFAILRNMETAIARAESTGTAPGLFSTDDEMSSPFSHNIQGSQAGSVIEAHTNPESSGILNPDSNHLAHDQSHPYDIASFSNSIDFVQDLDIFDFGSDAVGSIWNCIGLPGMNEIADNPYNMPYPGSKEVSTAKRGSIDTGDGSQPAAKMRKTQKRARSEHADRNDETALHQRLLQEQLEKSKDLPCQIRSSLGALLDHPEISNVVPDDAQVPRLRLLYITIGSCQSLLGFKDMLHTARNLSNIHSHSAGSDLRPPERYAEICRLDNQEALSVLLRRYHVVELFRKAQTSLFQDRGLIVETPSTHMTGQRAMPGNPANRAQADLTEEVLGMILPGLANGSPDYQKTRRHISQLRRLANILTIWTDFYGLGVLALLPSGANQSEFNLTDYMLLNMTEKRIKAFSTLLCRHQGQYLEALSKAVEPALMALVDGRLSTSAAFSIEILDSQVLERVPKGCVFDFLR